MKVGGIIEVKEDLSSTFKVNKKEEKKRKKEGRLEGRVSKWIRR